MERENPMFEPRMKGIVMAALLASVTALPACTHTGLSTVKSSAAVEAENASVRQALQTWLDTLARGKPEEMNALYMEQAVLLPTIANAPHNTAERIEYFKRLFIALPAVRGKVNEQYPQVYGNTAVNSGVYTFTVEKNKETVAVVPARFSFTYVRDKGQWKIVSHHSSRLPEEE
jgi:uncharacterized protein (TIGR02246 family)